MEKIIDQNDLRIEEQKKIIDEMLGTINANDPTFYYMNTSDIADLIFKQINTPGSVSTKKLEAVGSLSRRDIQILLSYQKAV
ncbi:MAG: hypothetical protein CME70_12245 [Halobacteriovorax sp.]|nr:hypothetical protein [Halobacteriovorax sp.]|tara:strand:+ start:274339 stop:274584 length:246 start_codon:yes stop_codon:yes gene_type:complete